MSLPDPTSPGSPLVSVIIPTYNYGRFLADAVESIRCQTVDSWEIIVIDDGSTDETQSVLEEVAGPDLTSVRTPNLGTAAARNRALGLSRGDYVAFIDADDRWRPDKLERQLSLITSEPSVDFVFCDFIRFKEDRIYPDTQFDLIPEMAEMETRRAESGNGLVLEGDPFLALTRLHLCPILPSNLLVRGELARRLRFPEGVPVSEDLYYFLQLYRDGRPGLIEEPLVEVRRHGDNTSGATLSNQAWDIRVMEMFLEEERLSSRRTRVLEERLGREWAGLGYHHFWSGRTAESFSTYVRALAFPGSRLNAIKHLLFAPVSIWIGLRRSMARSIPADGD